MMRITEAQLRRIIREEILNEAPPLIDMPSFENPFTLDRSEPSIGHPRTRSRRPRYRRGGYDAIARELMRDTRDDWVIITLTDFRRVKQFVETDEFKVWLREKDYPPGTRVLVVAGTPVKGDFRTPAWQIAHDTFGHAIEYEWFRFVRDHRVSDKAIETVTRALHGALPKGMQLSRPRAQGTLDIVPDILGAIILGKFDQETAMQVVDELAGDDPVAGRYYAMLVKGLFDSVDKWLETQATEDGIIIATPF
jgi:hypothetical protein